MSNSLAALTAIGNHLTSALGERQGVSELYLGFAEDGLEEFESGGLVEGRRAEGDVEETREQRF